MDTDTRSPFPEKQVNRNYLLQIFSLMFFLANAVAYGQLNDTGNKKNANPTSGKIELSILKTSDAPHTSPEHVYLIKAVNTADKKLSFSITTKNINCSGKKNSNMDIQVYGAAPEGIGKLSEASEMLTIPAQGSVEFYVKLIRQPNTILNTWNCSEVKATGNNISSNSIVLESFIPDPADFR